MVSFSQGVAQTLLWMGLRGAMRSRISEQVEENIIRSSSGSRSELESRAYIGEALEA